VEEEQFSSLLSSRVVEVSGRVRGVF